MPTDVVCPQKKCPFRNLPHHETATKMDECGNYKARFCPQSGHPWCFKNQWLKYPRRWESRSWCRNVWRNKAKEHGYDVHMPHVEEDRVEIEDERIDQERMDKKKEEAENKGMLEILDESGEEEELDFGDAERDADRYEIAESSSTSMT
jgi:hypothetical protein